MSKFFGGILKRFIAMDTAIERGGWLSAIAVNSVCLLVIVIYLAMVIA